MPEINSSYHARRKVKDIIVEDDLYPRLKTDHLLIDTYIENIDKLPPIEINQDNKLIDGLHRLTAHRSLNHEEIDVIVIQTKNDLEVLKLACFNNSTHGYQLSPDDKQRMARRMYNMALPAERPDVKTEIARMLSVNPRTVRNWLHGIDKKAAEEQREHAFDLWLSCHTQEEIGKALNIPQRTVADKVKDFSENGNLSKSAKISADFIDYEPPLYNVWRHRNRNEGIKYRGNTASWIVENLIYLYTNPFDIVVDPFAGGGSTIDICKKRSRRYFVSDQTPATAREKEIRKHDLITDDLPLVPRWKDVKLVYLDPPYWKQAEGWYSDSPSNLANMDQETFHIELAKIIDSFAKRLASGAKIALIIQPTQWKTPEHKGFVDHAAEMIKSIDLPLAQRIQCPYDSEQYMPPMVNWAKDNRRLLVISRELVVWEV